MKKSLSIAILLVLLTAMFMPGSVQAAEVTSYSSGFQIQNLSQSDAANITIKFYNRSDGTLAATTPSASIPAGSFSSFFTLSAVPVGFDGSAIIESDQPVAAVSLLYGNSNREHVDTYGGFSSGATSVFLPLIQKNNYQIFTWFNVQNTASSDAHITVNYPGTYTGNPCAETATIKPNAAARFDQKTNTCLPDGVYSATITSDQPVAVIVVEVYSTYQTLLPMIEAYSGFTDVGVTNPVFPSVQSGWYGSVNGIRIMNTGDTDTTVTLHFTPSVGFPGAVCDETKLITAGQSVSFANGYSRLMAPACRTLQSGYTAFVGSARVTANTANQTLVAISHQNSNTTAMGSTTNGFDTASATTALAFPLVVDRYNGATSGMVLYNAGSSDAHVTCTFTGTSFTLSLTIAPGIGQANPLKNLIADSYLGASYCTSDQPILGIGNYNTQVTATDSRGSYRAINY
jgi:hypothetical protein